MLYLLLIADSFGESALEELGRAGDYDIISAQHNLIVADVKAKDIRKLDRAKFIYSYFPLYKRSKIDKKRYMHSLRDGLAKLRLGKRKSLMLECLDVNCKKGYSAKDIEVALGTDLERQGYDIDLDSPKILAYCVLIDWNCYCGYVTLSEHAHKFIDPFRHHKKKAISRAEFKIIEAFREFGLKTPRIAIDIGAAPGGWSFFLAMRGASVIAIDSGELAYKKMRAAGVKVKEITNFRKHSIDGNGLPSKSIAHLKCGLDRAQDVIGRVDADLIGDDINVGGIESAAAVIRYSRFMKKNAVLLMTVKCMHRKVDRYMKEVGDILRPRFVIKRWKVLPHNRQEITLFAVKR